jgi:hypothetical protein
VQPPAAARLELVHGMLRLTGVRGMTGVPGCLGAQFGGTGGE